MLVFIYAVAEKWSRIHRLTSNEFIAVKKIFAMKIHRSEKETFIALSLLALFLLFLDFSQFLVKKVLIFVKKYLFSLFSLKESLKKSSS